MAMEQNPAGGNHPLNPSSALPQPAKQRRKWAPAPPAQRRFTHRTFSIVLAATVVATTVMFLVYWAAAPKPVSGEPKLGKEFIDYTDSFAITPPRNWIIDDRAQRNNLFLQGPREKGLSPLLIACWEPAPGRLETYVKEYKGRMEAEDKSIKWTAEEVDAGIDGCRTMRLEYDCDWQETDKLPVVKVHTLQFILDDRPRFYRITGHVSATLYDKYKAVFEASARTFRRIPIH